jgi:hypothetical protein
MKNPTLIRGIMAFVVMIATFVAVFLAIFVPLLLYDMHTAPHDGQGGMGGFFLGLPVASVVAFISGPCSFVWMSKRKWLEHPAK